MDVLIGVVTGGEVGLNRDGTVPGRLLQVAITEPDDVQTVEAPQAGEEFNPPRGCRVVLVEAGSGCLLSAGVDDGIAPVMAQGGKRIYSIDPTGAGVMVDLRFGPDGSISMLNQNGFGLTMSPDGHWSFLGVGSTFNHPVVMQHTLDVQGAATLDAGLTVTGDASATGTVTGHTDVLAAGVSGKGHHHTATTNYAPTTGPQN